MKIGIIGAGGIGQLYARLWLEAGHEVALSSRHPETLEHLAATTAGALTISTPQEAAAFGDVILLAANYASIDEAIAAIESDVAGKLVIDATNPLRLTKTGSLERLIGEDEIAGEVMARKIPAARVAKAFTSLWTGHVEVHANRTNPTAAMPFAADRADDRAVVGALIRDAGLVPVELGPLANSVALDPQSPIWNVVLSEQALRAQLNAIDVAAA